MQKKLIAGFDITTPIFMAGAQQEIVELRPASFKGVLRFWFRAIALSAVAQGGAAKPLEAVRQLEGQLFGSTEGKEANRARVTLRLRTAKFTPQRKRGVGTQRGDGMSYLGYGVLSYNRDAGKNLQVRACLENGVVSPKGTTDHEVKLILAYDPESISGFPHADLAEQLIIDSVKAIAYFGGVGARSRKGYGSLTLRSLAATQGGKEVLRENYDSRNDAQDDAKALVQRYNLYKEFPDYSAFSSHSFVKVFPARADADLLEKVGLEMGLYRSFGRQGRVFGRPSERNFQDDHDLMLEPRGKNRVPLRTAFGLPHNYFYSSQRPPFGSGVAPGGRNINLERRGSPLFISVSRYPDGSMLGLALLKGRFLPQGAELDLKIGRNTVSTVPVPQDLDKFYRPVEDFVNRLEQNLAAGGGSNG